MAVIVRTSKAVAAPRSSAAVPRVKFAPAVRPDNRIQISTYREALPTLTGAALRAREAAGIS
jgi:hypothetical protein